MHDRKVFHYSVRIAPPILGGLTYDEKSILAWTDELHQAKEYAGSFVRHPDATRVYVVDELTGNEVYSIGKPSHAN